MMPSAIHPTAMVHPTAQLHPTVEVGAYAVIGEQVKVGAHTTIGHHAVIERWTEIGDRNLIFPGAAIGLESQDLKYVGAQSFVKIGHDNRIREYVTINRATGEGEETVIGDGNLLMAYVHVAHNCQVGDRVVIANSVALAGHVVIESRATIGGLVGIHQFTHVGRLSMVGGMSRVDRDVPPYMIVEGNPSRVRGINRIGIERAGLGEETQHLLKQAFRWLYLRQIPLAEALTKLSEYQDNPHIAHLTHFLQDSLHLEGRRGLIPHKS